MTGRTLRILHVEDNLGDAQLTRLALGENRTPFALDHVRDGEEALQFLRREPPHAEAPRPDIVLLDLNMPGLGGHETLRQIKLDPGLRSIPVIVLTTSASPRDVARCFQAHVNAYIRKPIGFDEFVDAMRRLEEFWLEVAVLPSEH